MNNIISVINKLIDTPQTCSPEIARQLFLGKCLYILSRISNESSYWSCYLDTNRLIQNQRYLHCCSLFKELERIPYAIIKGAVLSNSIYTKPYYRMSGDIDILISPKYTEQVVQILKNNGFSQGIIRNGQVYPRPRTELIYHKLFTHQLATFQKKSDSLLCPFVTVDVNFDIFWGECCAQIDMDDFLLHTENTTIFNMSVKKLSPVYEFISMCMHHYKDMNSIYLLAKRGYCLNEFLDIYYYIVNTSLDVNELIAVARTYKVTHYIFYCIYHTNELFPNEKLKTYVEALQSPEGFKLLNHYGLTENERREWHTSLLDRLLDDRFQAQFIEQLSPSEKRKIDINSQFLLSQ